MDTDVRLYKRWQGGDREAGAELAQRHYRDLVRWLDGRRVSGYDDIAQSTWLIAQRSGTYTGRGSFAGWLRQIARSQIQERSRRERPSCWVEMEASSRFSPSRAVLRSELAEAVDAISQPAIREAVVRAMRGETPAEIAVQTGARFETVRSRLRLARRRLRERMRCEA